MDVLCEAEGQLVLHRGCWKLLLFAASGAEQFLL